MTTAQETRGQNSFSARQPALLGLVGDLDDLECPERGHRPCVKRGGGASTRAPTTLSATEQEQIRKLERLPDFGVPALVGASGELLDIPPTVYEVLRKVVKLMPQGKSVTLLPDNQVISTQRAADLLGMSRPSFIKLLETGAMTRHGAGNRRRVYLRDVLEFARKRAALDRLSQQSFEAGLYDRNVMPEGSTDG